MTTTTKTVREYAAERGVTPQTVRNEIKDGALPTGVSAVRVNSDRRRQARYRIIVEVTE